MQTQHWPVYGHDWAVEHLSKALLNQRVRHAYLLTGVNGVGKATLARAFAQALNCTAPDKAARPCGVCRSCKLITSGNHPDLLYPELDNGQLKIEEVRNACQKLALKPYEATYRIAIFRDFDRARGQAQDALLKTLEEPPPQALLILLASSVESVLPTIASRSQVLALRPVALETARQTLQAHFGAAPEQADLLARLCGGRLGWAIAALHEPQTLEQRRAALDLLWQIINGTRHERFAHAEGLGKDRPALYPLLELWQSFWRDVVLACENAPVPLANLDHRDQIARLARQITPQEALTALQATRNTYEQLTINLNLRLALEVLFLDYPGLFQEA